MNRRHVVRIAAGIAGALLVGLLVIFAMADPGERESADSPLLGRPAPEVISTTIDDAPFNLSRRRGSWVVLNFFNSTCVPCRQEHPHLVDFAEAQATSDDPAELFTIVNDDNDAAVRAYFDANGGSWPKVRDDDGAISVAFGIAKVPETWVVDPNGFVRLRIIGALTDGFLDRRVDELKTQFAGEQ